MKYVLVTGASSGIGQALTLHFQRIGFHVIAAVRKAEDAQKLIALSIDQIPTSDRLITPITLDISDSLSIKSATEAVLEIVKNKGLYALINNAGIAVNGALELVTHQQIAQQMHVNVTGTLAMTQSFLPLLKVAKGRIINIGSISGRFAPPGLSVYSASKYAIEGFSDALRVELKPFDIQVSVIAPGKIDTPIWQKSKDAETLSQQTQPLKLQQQYHKITQFYDNYAKTAPSTPINQVCHVVEHALTAKRAKPRYTVGRAAKLRVLLNYIPTTLRDYLIIKKIYG